MSRLSLLLSFFLLALWLPQCYSQTNPSCIVTATNPMERLEGFAEPSGDILLTCSGGTPGRPFTTNISVRYSTYITNRLDAAGAPDAVLTIDNGSGIIRSGVAPVLTQDTATSFYAIAFNGITLTAPAIGQTMAIRISNVRINIIAVAVPDIFAVGARISASGLQLSDTNATVAVANPSFRGLVATYPTSGILCVGSPLPTVVNLPNLFASGTVFASTRVTEGFAGAFIRKDAFSDAGTRFMVKYSSLPAGARVFVPDYVAGSDAVQPTAGGDLGGLQSGGKYSPSVSGSLLLARVVNADANGAGGSPISTAAAIPAGAAFSTVSELSLSSGAGSVVYETIDSNPTGRESAQFPTFISLGLNTPPAFARLSLSLAPVSTSYFAIAGLPVPRFGEGPPPTDCGYVANCGAPYFPKLSVSPTTLNFNPSTATMPVTSYVQVDNTGGGLLSYTFNIFYREPGRWLTVTDPNPGTNHTTLRLDANPATLAPGTYHASLAVNAGFTGGSVAITMVVPPLGVTINSVVNAATYQPGPLVAGSIATIFGTSLSGNVVTATFDGVPGTILFNNATQINVTVPASIAAKSSAALVVTADGEAGAPFTVALASVAPGIFGTLNQDNSLNSATNPAAAGETIQIFATGLISATSSGYLVGIGNRSQTPLYQGSMPDGTQQVNAIVPQGLNPGPVTMEVCAVGTDPAQLICSPGTTLFTK